MIEHAVHVIERFRSPASGEVLVLVAIGHDINLIKESHLASWLEEKEAEVV